MAQIDALPPDQRAVLQLVLQQGRSYDDIAGMLAIDRAAVRQRALDALAALGPGDAADVAERGLVTDYLLGQLPEPVAAEVSGHLASTDPDREWASIVRRQLEPLARGPLPPIPVGAPVGADFSGSGGELGSEPAPAVEPVVAEPQPVPAVEPAVAEPGRAAAAEPDRRAERAGEPERPVSRRGGAILLGIGAVVVVVVVILLLTGAFGSSGSNHPVTTPIAQSTGTGTTGTSTTTAKPKLLAALNLTSPTGASKTLGVAQVIREHGVTGIVIDAQGMPPNSKHNAYAVWLYNSATSSQFVGFVPTLVGHDGKLQTDGRLPADASKYAHVLITLETQAKPKTPGQVVLSGPFRETR